MQNTPRFVVNKDVISIISDYDAVFFVKKEDPLFDLTKEVLASKDEEFIQLFINFWSEFSFELKINAYVIQIGQMFFSKSKLSMLFFYFSRKEFLPDLRTFLGRIKVDEKPS